MTPRQRAAVDALKTEGFQVIGQGAGIVLMLKGSDHRVVMACGGQRRGQPVHVR